MNDPQTPWSQGDLRIRRSVLAAVEADALRGYAADEEACGYLLGPASDPLLCDAHVRMENVANKLHAMDPETYFRTARMYFAFNEARFDRAVREGAKAGVPVKVIYHSHLDAGAYFSPTDAAVMSCGEPPAEEGGAWKPGPGLYRTCVPGPDPARSLCVIVKTDQSPPGVTRDTSQEPNRQVAGPLGDVVLIR